MRHAAIVALLAIALPACSLPRGTLGHSEIDGASDLDAAVVDVDAWVAPGTDAGPPVDAFTPVDAFVAPDTGPTCMPHCDVDTAVTCPGGVASRAACGAGLCATTPTVHCLACVASSTSCSADGASTVQCDASGATLTMTHCDRGCSAGACRAAVSCASFTTDGMVAPPVTMMYDLCGNGADNSSNTTGPCSGFGSGGEDIILRLEIDRRQHLSVMLSDADSSVSVDSLVYLRRVCDDRSTELACSDDISSTNRNAAFTTDVDPGEYFLVLDTAAGSCGQVSLSVTGTAF